MLFSCITTLNLTSVLLVSSNWSLRFKLQKTGQCKAPLKDCKDRWLLEPFEDTSPDGGAVMLHIHHFLELDPGLLI
ncbi:hypothetical protein F4815DRAFT_475410 [Daldinia loculata]|nr:hypothetical protein F4815DRAFT_475410 [Daldinia loculata]